MRKKRVAIYDLDNTLIETNKLKDLRKKRDWKNIYTNFDKTFLNIQVKEYIEKLNKEIFNDYIIVTSAPKIYAQNLLNYHNFLEDAKIIGYHDTKRHKPFCDPYIEGIKFLQEFDEIYVFGDSDSDFKAAEYLTNIINEKVYKVGCSWYVKCTYEKLDRVLTLNDLNKKK